MLRGTFLPVEAGCAHPGLGSTACFKTVLSVFPFRDVLTLCWFSVGLYHLLEGNRFTAHHGVGRAGPRLFKSEGGLCCVADLCWPVPFFWDVHGEEKGSPLQNRLPRCQRTGLRVVSGTQLDRPVASPFVFFPPPWKMKPSAYHLKVLAKTFLRRVVLLEQTQSERCSSKNASL